MSALLQSAIAAHHQAQLEARESYQSALQAVTLEGRALAVSVARKVLHLELAPDAVEVETKTHNGEPEIKDVKFWIQTEVGPLSFYVKGNWGDAEFGYTPQHCYLEVWAPACNPRYIHNLAALGEFIETILLPEIGMEELPHG